MHIISKSINSTCGHIVWYVSCYNMNISINGHKNVKKLKRRTGTVKVHKQGEGSGIL